MTKLKTRKSAAKRFRVSATGKVLHGHQMRRHLRRKKSDSNMRAKAIPGQATGVFAKKIRAMLGA